MSDEDRHDWAGVCADDEAALARLFDRHADRLFRHATRMLSVREDAKDAVTIAFAELWRKRNAVRLVDGTPLPLLLNTVSNSARNLERSARRYRNLLARTPRAEDVPSPELVDESGLLAALRELPGREREVVVLTILEGYPEKDTAAALGIPVGTVKSRLARAKTRLRHDIIPMWEA